MTDVRTLLSSNRCFVVAPAGCGKTQLIAKAVCSDTGHRSLVLTHTYAGVDALRKRLEALGANSDSYRVDTIAGWSLRLAASFPRTSGIATKRPTANQWDAVYSACSRLLSVKALRAVVRASFDSAYVDEYQDCSPLQHDIVLKIADILPTRILGDPLQGIFDFGGSGIIDWHTHVEPHFSELPRLCQPHRWETKNRALGHWLLEVRRMLEANQPIDLRQGPDNGVKFVRLPPDRSQRANTLRKACMSARCPNGETMVAIHSWERQCHKIARHTGGKFWSTETIECDELFNAAKAFDNATDSAELARAAFAFACLCTTKIKTELERTAGRIFDGGGLRPRRQNPRQEQLNALAAIINDGSYSSVSRALVTLARTPGAAVVRRELFGEMLRALQEWAAGGHACLEEAAIRTRDHTRRTGRALGRYVISRTLLVKGLEFDHALILDANALDRRNLYVALTRASRSLTVFGTSPVLNPR